MESVAEKLSFPPPPSLSLSPFLSLTHSLADRSTVEEMADIFSVPLCPSLSLSLSCFLSLSLSLSLSLPLTHSLSGRSTVEKVAAALVLEGEVDAAKALLIT